MGTSICKDFNQARTDSNMEQVNLSDARLSLKSAENELRSARAWTPNGKKQKAYSAATKQYQQAQLRFRAAQYEVRLSQEAALRYAATGDEGLSERIKKRRGLSMMLGTLEIIRSKSELARSAQSRSKTNLTNAATDRAQATDHYATMVLLAKQFNQTAEEIGLPAFNSASAKGIDQELQGMTQKVSAALQATMKQLDADYQALEKRCQ